MKKQKAIVVAVCLVVVVIITIILVRVMQNAIFASTQYIQQLGEMPLEQEDEEVWVSPTISWSDVARENGDLDGQPEPETTTAPKNADAAEEELVSVPVEETPEELAGTAQDNIVEDTGAALDGEADDAALAE